MKKNTLVGITVVVLSTLVMWLCVGLAFMVITDWKLRLVTLCLIPVGVGTGLLLAELKRSK